MVDVAAIADGVRSSHFENAGFAQVYGSAHFPQFEQAAQTNAAIEAFLARL